MKWINKPDKVTKKVSALIDGNMLAERGTRKGRPIVWYDEKYIRRVNYTGDSGIWLACVDECDAQGRTTADMIEFS